MKVLVVNAGSSSLKYQLLDMETETVMAKGNCERIGLSGSFHKHKTSDGRGKVYSDPLPTHLEAVNSVLASLTDKEVGVIASLDEIDAIGHRVVQGAYLFDKSTLIDDEVTDQIEKLAELAPLHNKAHAIGIRMCHKALPNTPMVAVFDTTFHQTIPEVANMYALPYEMSKEYKIRRYGAHGTSNRYVVQETAKLLGKDLKGTKIIVCHLGNGSSVTAVKDGESIDTSMGLTPLDGFIMGTRCGAIDPAIIPYIINHCGVKPEDLNYFLNEKCGVEGVSGVSSDFRDLEAAAEEGNERAKLALNMFAYQVKKFVGAYMATLNGTDAIVFTAGIGENDDEVRRNIMEGLDNLGAEIDVEKNKVRGNIDITGPNSKIKIFVIPTNEELMIARDTVALLKKN